MSVQAMAWAMDLPQTEVESSTARHVLLVLANYADQEGRHAFPAVSTIARQTGLTVRSIRMTLASLLDLGVIKLGNQAIVAAHIDRADRRPVVYDLCITGVNAVHPAATGCISRPHGVNVATARGEPGSPKPSFNHQRAFGDRSPERQRPQPGEPDPRQPAAAEVIERHRAKNPATPEQAKARLEEIARALKGQPA